MKTKPLLILGVAVIAALGLLWVASGRGRSHGEGLDGNLIPGPDPPGSVAPQGPGDASNGASDPPMAPRLMAGAPADPGPASDGAAEGIARLIEYGRALGPKLDFVKPWPDPEQLESLRSITLASGISTGALQAAAESLPADDPGRVALIAASAWAAEPSDLTDLWLRSLAADWSQQTVAGEQGALAAVLAMDLGGRTAALELAAEELMELSGGDEDSPSFAGLAGIRTWHALRGLDEVDEATWGPRFERWFSQDTPERRVNEELWALAVRSSKDWRERALQGALAVASGPSDQRVTEVLGGVESLPPAASEAEATRIEQLAEAERAGWISGAAAKALAASGTEDASRWLSTRLRSGLIARDQALEALRTWRLPMDPGPTFARLAGMSTELPHDDEARAALRLGLERTVDRLRFRRSSARRTSAAAGLRAAAALVAPDDPWAAQLGQWSRQLTGAD